MFFLERENDVAFWQKISVFCNINQWSEGCSFRQNARWLIGRDETGLRIIQELGLGNLRELHA